ncbi:MAG: Casein kinase II subunit alpha' [Sporothrix thermara]
MATHAGIRVPQISSEELFAFHESHFSHVSVADFGATFTSLPEPTNDDKGELDGVEQARESLPQEEEGERREEEEGEEGDDYDPETGFDLYDELPDIPVPFDEGELAGDGEIVEGAKEDGATAAAAKNATHGTGEHEQPRSRKRRRKKQNTGNSNARRLGEKQPDLRKRTWDKVDSGLGSLDYDGAEASASAMQSAPLRRRVQYDDDD